MRLRTRSGAILIVLLSLFACGTADSAVAPSVPLAEAKDVISDSIAEFKDAAAELSTSLASVESKDLDMAWSDLDSDVMSAVDDMRDDPSSVDIEGLRRRIHGFGTRFNLTQEPLWEEFVASFDDFLSQLDQGASDSTT